MTDELGWTDVHELGYRLFEAHPEIDPLTVRFTDLHSWVTELEGFTADPKASNENVLEAIQMAWLDERDRGRAARPPCSPLPALCFLVRERVTAQPTRVAASPCDSRRAPGRCRHISGRDLQPRNESTVFLVT